MLQDANDSESKALRRRIERLRGAIAWNVKTQYHQRLTEAHEHLRELNEDMEILAARYDAFVRTRQAATHSYVGYEIPINRLHVHVDEALDRLERLMAQQGHVLESVAIDELTGRRERLEAYQNQARFAFADSYDRAAKAQAR
jgi:chromosome segregation ATPase